MAGTLLDCTYFYHSTLLGSRGPGQSAHTFRLGSFSDAYIQDTILIIVH